MNDQRDQGDEAEYIQEQRHGPWRPDDVFHCDHEPIDTAGPPRRCPLCQYLPGELR